MAGKFSICVYCGSQVGRSPSYLDAAKQTGAAIAAADCDLVYGGGASGIMGAVSSAARNAGGVVHSVIPEFLIRSEGANRIDRSDPNTHITPNMHVRKQTMFELSDAFLALPGGIGTLEEVVEMMTWAQLGRHGKPIAFLNTGGFWDPVSNLLSHMQSEGFIHSAQLLNPIFFEEPEAAVSGILSLLGQE